MKPSSFLSTKSVCCSHANDCVERIRFNFKALLSLDVVVFSLVAYGRD
jgi:hypothetical protein